MEFERHWPLIATVFLLSACSGLGTTVGGRHSAKSPETLLVILADVSAPDDDRIKADRQLLQAIHPADWRRLAALQRLVYVPGQSDALRIYAMDQLFIADPRGLADVLITQMARMEAWPVLRHACDLAVKLNDPRLIDPLVRSLNRPAVSYARKDRPEAGAVARLAGKPLNDVLLQRLLHSPDAGARIAALDLLRELEYPDALRAKLLAAENVSPFVADVQWSIQTFDYIPIGPNEALWLHELRKDRYSEIVTEAARAHRMLADEDDYAFAPRFVAILAQNEFNPAQPPWSRAQLLSYITLELSALKHVAREPEYPHAPDDVDESLEANAAKLSRCDLLTILFLLNHLPDAQLRQSLYKMGLDDMADKTSEHGGLLNVSPDNGLVATLYPPLVARSDYQYIPTYKMYADAAASLAMFHFHFQKNDNQASAGPGEGDLKSAASNHFTGVVITAVGAKLFNVDYFNPQGAVVDLGVYRGD